MKEIGVVETITLKLFIKKLGLRFVDWIYLVQDRNQWWAFVNKAVNLLVSLRTQYF
jgi:hypothetical protein